MPVPPGAETAQAMIANMIKEVVNALETNAPDDELITRIQIVIAAFDKYSIKYNLNEDIKGTINYALNNAIDAFEIGEDSVGLFEEVSELLLSDHEHDHSAGNDSLPSITLNKTSSKLRCRY